jgi:leader peptidase (prepilin peptidase) / N-methyltransferase
MTDREPPLAWLAAQRWTLAAMAAGVAVSLYLLPAPVSIFAAIVAALAVFIAVVDLEHFVIPDAANLALLALGLALVVLEAPPSGALAALGDAVARGLAGGGALLLLRFVYLRLAGIEGLGLGDVKLAAAGALSLAWPTLPIALLIASIGGLLAIGARALGSRKMPDRVAEIPFGAFLAPAIWLAFVLERTGTLMF